MTHKLLRDTIALIRESGGENVEVRSGGRHLFVGFDNTRGERHELTLHLGNKVKSHADKSLRSQIRRAGLAVA